MKHDDEFYVGYLPKAPAHTARFTRRAVAGLTVGAVAVGALLAGVLPFYGAGVFEFGHPRVYRGTVRCDGVPRLSAEETDYLLVGPGKHGVPFEVCAASGHPVALEATRIARAGTEVLEVVPGSMRVDGSAVVGRKPRAEELGTFTLRGEIVDPKCFFGVMNPGEGRLHRACAILCLRGGITPVLVVRDRTGAEIHVALRVPASEADGLLQRVAEPVEVSGVVSREGHWLVMETDLARVRAVDGGERSSHGGPEDGRPEGGGTEDGTTEGRRAEAAVLPLKRGVLVVHGMSIAELRQLPNEEKLRIIEALWADLSADEASFESPDWHVQELARTEADVAAGKAKAVDWDEAKKELRRRFN